MSRGAGSGCSCRQWWWYHPKRCDPFLSPQLVKTHDLSPSHNYIIGSHPHGILCVGAFCNFVTGSTGFGEMFPGIRPSLTTLAGNFRLPVFREYLMSGGELPWAALWAQPVVLGGGGCTPCLSHSCPPLLAATEGQSTEGAMPTGGGGWVSKGNSPVPSTGNLGLTSSVLPRSRQGWGGALPAPCLHPA